MGFRVALDLSASVPVARKDFLFQGLLFPTLTLSLGQTIPLGVKAEEGHF